MNFSHVGKDIKRGLKEKMYFSDLNHHIVSLLNNFFQNRISGTELTIRFVKRHSAALILYIHYYDYVEMFNNYDE